MTQERPVAGDVFQDRSTTTRRVTVMSRVSPQGRGLPPYYLVKTIGGRRTSAIREDRLTDPTQYRFVEATA